MAKRKGGLAGLLADLVEQRDGLLNRIRDLETSDVGDVGDAAATVERLRNDALELDASRRTLEPLEARISAIRADLANEQTDEQRQAVERLWPKEHAAMDTVVRAVAELRQAVDALAAVQRQIADLGGLCKAAYPRLLVQVLDATEKAWVTNGTWHDSGGSLRQWYAESVQRHADGTPEPWNPAFVELMKDKRCREAFTERTGLKVIGRGDGLRLETDERAIVRPGF